MEKSGAPLFVGLGEVLWDLLPDGKQLGGAPANFAYHAQAQGARGLPVSCVGKDELGREIAVQLTAVGLDTHFLATTDTLPTGTVDVKLDAAGVPTFTICAPVAWDAIPFTPEMKELAGRADGVCFGSLAQRDARSRASIGAFLDATRPDALRIFDVNVRQEYYSLEVLECSLRRANVFKLNDQELPIVAKLLGLGCAEPRAALPELARRYDLRLVALTCGGEGSLLFSAGRFSEHAGVKAEVVDTVGAGDSFTATLAVGLLNGGELDALNRNANQVAAFVCAHAGATPVYEERLRGLWR
jgi:fructokinase